MGIAEIGFYFLLEKDFQKIFFLNSDSMYCRKMYGLVRCIPILGRGGRGGFITSAKRMCICVYVIILKMTLVVVKNVFFGLKKGISG